MTVSTPTVDLRGDRKRRNKERIAHGAFLTAGLTTILISALIIITLFGEALNFLRVVDLGSLWSDGWFPRRGLFDLRTVIVGTFLITGVALLVAIPLGLGGAFYLAEYASPRVRKILKPALEVLAGVPSVALGFFALVWINPEIVQRIRSEASTFTMLAAGIGVGVLVTPIIATVGEDAIRAVPHALREASYGLGARKMQTVTRVVFPAAISGIVAAIIIAMSRAIGETMVVAIAAGGSGGTLFTTDVFGPGQAITGAMASLAVGTDQVAGGAGSEASAAFNSLFFLGLLLFFMTLLLNVIGDIFVRRVREAY